MKSWIIKFLIIVIILFPVLTACISKEVTISENPTVPSISPVFPSSSAVSVAKSTTRQVVPDITMVDLSTPLVLTSDLIVYGKITDSKKPNQGSSWTIYTLSVIKMVKGDPQTKTVSIGVDTGYINSYSFDISNQVLLALKKSAEEYSIVDVLFREEQNLVMSFNNTRVTMESAIAHVVYLMQENNIPVACDTSDIAAFKPPLKPSGETFGFKKGDTLNVLNSNGQLDTYDLSTFKPIRQNKLGSGISLVSSPDGQSIFSASSDDMTIKVINIQTGIIERQTVLNDLPGDIGFLSSGELYVTFPKAKTVEIFDPSSFASLKVYQTQYVPEHLAFSPDGKYLYETFNDANINDELNKPANTFAAIETTTNRTVARSRLPSGIHTIVIPQKGNRFYINHRTTGLSVVDSKDFYLNQLPHPTKPFDKNNSISGMAVSPNNDHLFVGSYSYIRDLDPATGELIRQIDVNAGNNLYITPGGKYLIATSGGGYYIDTPGPPPSATITFIDLMSWQVAFRLLVENGAATVLASSGF